MSYAVLACSVLPDGSGRAFLRQDKFEDRKKTSANGDDIATFKRRQAAKDAAAKEQNIHESPGQKIKRQLGLDD